MLGRTSASSRLTLVLVAVLAGSLAQISARAIPSYTPPWDVVRYSQPSTLASYLQHVVASVLAPYVEPIAIPDHNSGYKTFGLREAYHQGLGDKAYIRAKSKYDFRISESSYIPRIKTTQQRVTRAKDPKRYLEVRGTSYEQAVCAASTELEWEDVDLEVPDVTDRTTVLAFAKMAASAYDNDTSQWDGIGGFEPSNHFGWEGDGIRGHIFSTHDNDTIVVALKGTSNAFLPGGGETARRDKMNDNLLFSCCCARVSWSWSTVCDCYQGHGNSCGQTCLERALVEKSLYYPALTTLFNNISYTYPDSQIWITGHSLGGALSALLGMTFGIPTVTFQAPGERMAAMRLHLPVPPSKHPDESPVAALPIVHVYNNADPIATGQCTGAGSFCSNFGYAMESKCHAGKSIVYDTVGQLGWAPTINAHRIQSLIDDVLSEDWNKLVHKKKSKALSARDVHTQGWHWPWHRGDGTDDDDSDHDTDGDTDLAVPRLRSEDQCKDCVDWHFSDDDE